MTERERRQKIIDLLRAGETRQAAEELAGSQEPYPGDGLLHHAIGLAFASDGTLGPAREQLEAAARLSPQSAIILADLSQVRLAQGKPQEAIETVERALELEPELAIAHFTLGRAFLAEDCAHQGRNSAARSSDFEFPVIDGRTPLYLRALREMETALYAGPSFVAAIRAALAFAYLRAGHFHAACEQLQQQLAESDSREEAERVSQRLQFVEYETIREDYWGRVAEAKGHPAVPGQGEAESLLQIAHAQSLGKDSPALAQALAQARSAGYSPRPALVARFDGEDEVFQEVSDVHVLIGGGLECILEGRLRFLPFDQIETISLASPAAWRQAHVTLRSGEEVDVAVPNLYRLSLRSPNDLIQSGRFTQFRYGPGETRYAHAIGTRNLATEDTVIPFTDVKAITFV
jgi:protein involved in temperature-dependent protein secretion